MLGDPQRPKEPPVEDPYAAAPLSVTQAKHLAKLIYSGMQMEVCVSA
jgi:hypothetical protein